MIVIEGEFSELLLARHTAVQRADKQLRDSITLRRLSAEIGEAEGTELASARRL